MQLLILRMLSPKGFTLYKEKLPMILNLKSSSSSQEKNFRGYECFMCWAWPSDSRIYENKGLPEARSEAAPLIPRILRGLYLTHDMSGSMLHTVNTRYVPKNYLNFSFMSDKVEILIHKPTKKLASIN
jgi:hypothetical protein